MQNRDVDEVLEIIWMQNESGNRDLCVVESEIKTQRLQNVLVEMQNAGLVKIEGANVLFTKEGEEKAGALIRRHRLAERLLADVLEAKDDAIEASACEFEHVISEEVTDAICTLLGHPKECPHGLKIPEVKCCKKAKEVIDSLVTTLDKAPVGENVTVAYILANNHSRLHKLMSFGISPGVKIKIHQKYPAYIIQVDETQIALEKEVVSGIYIRKN